MNQKIKSIPAGKIQIRGDICRRINLNYSRLESKHYRPRHIFSADHSGWPGDWEGRTILALVKLKNITGREPAYLREIIKLLPEMLNEKGYLGPIYGKDEDTGLQIFNEQQLSGHNWLLRGLLEYYIQEKDENIRKISMSIINNLYMPLLGQYSTYPLDPDVRGTAGRYDGNICGKVGNWLISTDIGCAFMCLDAVTQAYEIFDIPFCKSIADEMIASLLSIDFEGVKMQTHATLSATRGILRMYGATGDSSYIDAAKKLFTLYTEKGMSDNFANINWFGRPDTWTEPCAIVDSWICAIELYKYTEIYDYLKLANNIYRNAICYAQRLNGGFGCDSCAVMPIQKIIHPHGGGLSEAYWCCTMRGAEGLSAAGNNIVCVSECKNGKSDTEKIYINMWEDVTICQEKFNLTIEACHIEGKNTVHIINKTQNNIEIIAYNPVKDFPLTFTAVPGENIFKTDFDYNVLYDGKRIWHGDFILSVKGICQNNILDIPDLNTLEYIGSGMYKNTRDGYILQPLSDMSDLEYEETLKESRQILF